MLILKIKSADDKNMQSFRAPKDLMCIFNSEDPWSAGFFRVEIIKLIITYIKQYLSNNDTSGSGITPCNKIDKPLVVYRFSGNIMTYITTLHT